MASKFRLALIQLAVSASKPDNLANAALKIKEAATKGAQIVALPECFNSPYGTGYFPEYAENIPGNSTEVLSKAAKENSIFLVGGSIPESKNGKLFNTCTIYNPAGEMIASHEKVHLFDIDVPGKIRFKESETLSPGSKLTTFDTPFCKIGVGICYDIRFAEMAQIYAKNGCKLLLYPGAFNMTTGPAHWELLQRARAIDNQLYVAAVSPARCETASYIAWGHSTVISPWGDVVSTTEHAEDIVYADIALTWTAVAAGPLFQTATLGNGIEQELQEATPGSVLQQVTDDLNVDQYLRRYGYMNDVNERSQDYDQHKADALKSFQSFAGLQVTGEENEETRQQMLRPRCGMKDLKVERPSNSRWNMSEITYWFKNYTPDLDKTSIHQAFEDALGQWSGPSKLNFKKIESGTPIMEISFVTRKHTGCYFAMDGPGGVLAHAFFPARHHWAGDIHFDDDETYKYKTGRGYEIASVTLHEAGHSLGLGHDSSRGSIMMPWYNGQTTLGPNDIARIKSLYA